jgi:hypothetical protein
MIGRDLTSIKKIPSSHRPYDLRMFRFMMIFMACFLIVESYAWEIFTKCGARTQVITSSSAPIFGMPTPWGFTHYM